MTTARGALVIFDVLRLDGTSTLREALLEEARILDSAIPLTTDSITFRM